MNRLASSRLIAQLMVFSSHIFLFYFLPAVLVAYYVAPARWRNAVLTLASYVFYGWWSPWFTLLMLASTVIDFQCGRRLAAAGGDGLGIRSRRAAVAVSATANLGLLIFFKYWMFLAENANVFLGAVGGWSFPSWEIVLPVGISFYTFQSMSYTIDLYRGHARPARTFLDFAAYVSLFPQLVAGPIVRYRDLDDQLRDRPHNVDGMVRGLCFFVFGLTKKVLLANPVGEIADATFAAGAPPWHIAWVGVIAYAFQIYFDFSGYSDMAIGLGQMFGFRLPPNFRSPYRARSITEFWHRWHISLSTWLRDYLYIPLGGNRKGVRRTYVNLAITMLLGGLWHGAQWTFIAWGAMHGVLLIVERVRGRGLFSFLPGIGQQAGTFVLILITWVLFRAESLSAALDYLAAMFAITPTGYGATLSGAMLTSAQVYGVWDLLILALAAFAVWRCPRTEQWIDRAESGGVRPAVLMATVVLFVISVFELSVQGHNPFLYFQF